MDGKAGSLKLRPCGEMVHGTDIDEMVHFAFFHAGTGEKLGDNSVGDEASKYLHVLIEEVSGYSWLEPALACTAAVTAKHLLHWCAAMWVLRVWVSDTA